MKTPAVSPDGKSFAFRARSARKWFVVKNGERLAGDYNKGSALKNSPSGSRLIFAGVKGSVVSRGQVRW